MTASLLVGRGSVDMKAGVAVMLSLAATLTNASRSVTYVFYDLEEVESTRNGLGRIARENPEWLTGDFAVLLEPTSGVIEGGCNGTLRADVTIPGVAAHSARSWKGVNAIHGAAPLLSALAEYQAETIVVDGLEYREGLNAVGIRGGIAGNVVPDECVVTINYRFAPSWDVDKAQRRLEDVVDGSGVEGATIAWTDVAPGARPGLDAPTRAGVRRNRDGARQPTGPRQAGVDRRRPLRRTRHSRGEFWPRQSRTGARRQRGLPRSRHRKLPCRTRGLAEVVTRSTGEDS